MLKQGYLKSFFQEMKKLEDEFIWSFSLRFTSSKKFSAKLWQLFVNLKDIDDNDNGALRSSAA